MSVIWKALLFNEKTEIEGRTDDGSWKKLKRTLYDSNLGITNLFIEVKGIGVGDIDSNKDGYMITNKVIVSLQGGPELNLVGIGYWDKHAKVVRTKWYNSETMELVNTEAKNEEECEFSLIRNPDGR